MIRSDICLSVGNVEYHEVLEHLKKVPFAEIRLDMLNLSPEQIISIFSTHNNLIATFRRGIHSDEQRAQALMVALESGAAYVEVEIDAAPQWRKPIIEKARALNRKVIVSYHNFKTTPGVDDLHSMVESLFDAGADIAKLACMVNSPEDNARILGLYASYKNLVAVGMGAGGIITRVVAPLMGAPFTFASISGAETAPGQFDEKQLRTIIGFLESYTVGNK
jgi:3-dehydroquinate dehydratase type I